MNPIVVLTRNNIELTKKAVASFEAQDVEGGVNILAVDNDSTDGTMAWLATKPEIATIANSPQRGVAHAWNQALRWLFKRPIGGKPLADYALVCNNDVVLRPDAYRWLLADGGGFVTCVGSDDPKKIERLPEEVYDCYLGPNVVIVSSEYPSPSPSQKRPHPDFSCFLIRRDVWEKVGPFDECFSGAFAEDASYHLRMHRAGIRAEALELPFYHYGSATVKLADPKERKRIQVQADKNRALFKKMYGFELGSEAYYREFGHGAPNAIA